MKKLLATTVLIIAATQANAETRYARVTSVQANYDTVYRNVPRNQCQNVEVPIYGTVQGNGNAGESALLGMIIGGIVGDAVSGGDGNATAGGAVIGGIIGADRAQNGTRQVITGYRTERQCTEVMVRQESREIRNYTITYEWEGIRGSSYTYNDYSVGDRIPVTVSINAN